MTFARPVYIIRLFWIVCLPTYLSAQDPAATLKTLHGFNGTNGEGPVAGVSIGGDGILYGTTTYGGLTTNCNSGCGVVYSLTPPTTQGAPWKAQDLYRFTGGADGGWPYGGIAIGSNGVLYGATTIKGDGFGTVFSLTPPSSPGGAWTLNTIWTFSGGSDGAGPYGGVVIGSGGVLYGTTNSGGNSSLGVVFSLTPPASPGGVWTETVLHQFTFTGDDGFASVAPLAIGAGGVLYGTTESGGAFEGGTVFSVTPPAIAGDAWTEAVLHSFAGGSDGSLPTAGVTVNAKGILFGTTNTGGGSNNCANDCGTVYALVPPTVSGAIWTEKILYSFSNGANGANPYGGVAIGAGGVLYVATPQGGDQSCTGGCGTVISLTPPASAGGEWTPALVYSFTGGNDGGYPEDTLALSSKGLFYGTAGIGGPSEKGTVFSLKP
jgi:uncharacterized repeat protein (TIGR03803 family)